MDLANNDLLFVENAHKKFKKTQALINASFSLQKGKIIGIFGENGSGKTTLLKGLCGIICFDNYKAINLVKNETAFVIEEPKFYPNFTGEENLIYFLRISEKHKELLDFFVNQFQMKEYINKSFKSYSLGMKQKLAICYLFLQNKKYLLLDEPMNGLDILSVKKVKDTLLMMRNNKAIVIISHNITDLEDLCDEIFFLHKGEFIGKTTINQKSVSNFEISFFDENDVNEAIKLIKNSKKNACNSIIIKVEKEEMISKIIEKISSFSIKEVVHKKNTILEYYNNLLKSRGEKYEE